MTDIKDFRKEIDTIDAEIAKLLAKRLKVVKEIAAFKEANSLPVLDAAREQDKLNKLEELCDSGSTPYVTEVFREIMAASRRQQQDTMSAGAGEHATEPRYGLLGRRLSHSYSPQIHRLIGDYEFGLFDKEPEELDAFFKRGTFRGITVTMPYKKTVMKYCSEISETALKCRSVNTIVRRADGTYFGDNTDYYGFQSTVLDSGVSVKGAKAIVLGSGGVSGTAVRVLQDMGASPVIVISRSGPENYDNLSRHYDAQIIVNATPVGMYPNAGEAVIDIKQFTKCEAVFDLIYNPLRTKLMLDARSVGVSAFGGLHMLTAQAAKAYQLFCDANPELGSLPGQAQPSKHGIDLAAVTQRACGQLRWDIENIVLIGMPGCGKTTIGKRLSEITGKPFYDCDAMITEHCGRSPEEIITSDGVDRFRDIETDMIKQVLRRPPETAGIVFATGGGCVEREENLVPLLENSLVVYIARDVSDLPTEGRPVSQADGAEAIYARRKDKYEQWSDLKAVL